MSEPQPHRVVYSAKLVSLRGDVIHALRAILKSLLRKFGWRCVCIEREPQQ